MRILILTLTLAASLPAGAEVTLHGVEGAMASTVRNFLSLGEDCGLARWVVRYRFRGAEDEIRQALQTFGYYSPAIDKSLTFDDTCWHASIDIQPGEPVRIGERTVQVTGDGADDKAFTTLLNETPISKGAVFDHEKYEGFKSRMEQVATQRGYFDGNFSAREVIVDVEAHTATIDLVFDTGPRYRFGAVSFEDAPLKERLMHRYLPFEPGDPYNANEIGALYQALINSGYFDDVIVNTDVRRDEGVVNVDIKLIPGDPHKTRIGAGFSTDIGPKVTASYTNRRLNTNGHRIEGNLSIAPVRKEIGAQYRIPTKRHRDGWTSFYGGFSEEKTETSLSDKSTIGIRQLRPRSSGWFETRFIEIIDDRFEIADEDRTNFSIVPGIGWRHETSALSSRPLEGHHLGFELSGTSEAIGSTLTYTQAVVTGKVIRPLWSGARVISRLRVGATVTDHFERLPPSVRFFSGGDDRVRGYEFKSLGPKDENGEVIGGDRVVEASLEIDQLIQENWAVAVFFDAGNATLDDFGSNFAKGAGLGIRWYSPLGPLRLDLAAPVDSEVSGLRVHMSFGPDI